VSGRNDSIVAEEEAGPRYSAFVEAISRSLAIDRKDKYLTTRAPEEYTDNFQALFLDYINRKPDLDPLFSTWLQNNSSLMIGGHRLIDVVRRGTSGTIFTSSPTPDQAGQDVDFNTFLSRFSYVTRQMARKIMVTNDGILGMAPCRARKGDVVVILFGCSIPVVLRPTVEAYQVIGEAYVHGYMNGEIKEEISNGIREAKVFRLI
jgi:hypothetical protein